MSASTSEIRITRERAEDKPKEGYTARATTESSAPLDIYRGDVYDPFYDPYGGDIAHMLPRHVGSRLLSTPEGEVLWRPAADVFETDEMMVIHVDLPGVPKEEITVDVRGNELFVFGETKSAYESATSRVRERRIGKFRKILLVSGINQSADEVDTDKITATYTNGLLEVLLPKKEVLKGKRISIS